MFRGCCSSFVLSLQLVPHRIVAVLVPRSLHWILHLGLLFRSWASDRGRDDIRLCCLTCYEVRTIVSEIVDLGFWSVDGVIGTSLAFLCVSLWQSDHCNEKGSALWIKGQLQGLKEGRGGYATIQIQGAKQSAVHKGNWSCNPPKTTTHLQEWPFLSFESGQPDIHKKKGRQIAFILRCHAFRFLMVHFAVLLDEKEYLKQMIETMERKGTREIEGS